VNRNPRWLAVTVVTGQRLELLLEKFEQLRDGRGQLFLRITTKNKNVGMALEKTARKPVFGTVCTRTSGGAILGIERMWRGGVGRPVIIAASASMPNLMPSM
jgi:hypothetical protein